MRGLGLRTGGGTERKRQGRGEKRGERQRRSEEGRDGGGAWLGGGLGCYLAGLLNPKHSKILKNT